jgi:hypothetical protein
LSHYDYASEAIDLLALALTEGVILRRERSELPINIYPPQPKARGYPLRWVDIDWELAPLSS